MGSSPRHWCPSFLSSSFFPDQLLSVRFEFLRLLHQILGLDVCLLVLVRGGGARWRHRRFCCRLCVINPPSSGSFCSSVTRFMEDEDGRSLSRIIWFVKLKPGFFLGLR
ncbi:hypothetical protein MTR_2g070760 [Medicago truncatula]|uniref:Uncharacterized protein n=1 Tax=Medicago truncatula TaxID=3880 RepID=A0A072V9F2_MEDTR|nr:hypothetical protein MTR_2g070760 [Medicago truncatula]